MDLNPKGDSCTKGDHDLQGLPLDLEGCSCHCGDWWDIRERWEEASQHGCIVYRMMKGANGSRRAVEVGNLRMREELLGIE